MSELLFHVEESPGTSVTALRAALERAVEVAKQEAALHRRVVDLDEADIALDELAATGDESWAKDGIREACDMDQPDGLRACADILDHVGIIHAAWLRLAKAERGER